MLVDDHSQQVPPFPSNIHIADIPIISYTNLKDQTGDDSQNLFTASWEQGFFMLDLRGNEDGEQLLKSAEAMFEISNAVFSMGHEALLKYKSNLPYKLYGYKPPGTIKTDDGRPEVVESYNLSQEDILSENPSNEDPEVFLSHRERCQEFFQNAHKAVVNILNNLDRHLGLEAGKLASLCPLEKPSSTALRMLLMRPQEDDARITFGGHTDIGVITMLFHLIGGLQVLPAGSENINSNWRYIHPEPGCVLINIGDSLVEWTGGVLRSPLHRVVHPPGEHRYVIRRSLAYLVRPERDASMSRLSSHVIPALADNEEKETRSVSEWTTWVIASHMNGKLKAESGGGQGIAV